MDAKGAGLPPDLEGKSLKKRPRGRPWPKGTSGNPAGRPRGARNKFTMAMLAGIRQAEEELARPRMLDPSKPYEYWDGYLIQEGVVFDCDTHEALPDQDSPLEAPKRFNPAERRTEMVWKGLEIIVQYGWAFDPATWKRLKF
ncbi:MAG: hypothetical protein JRI66_11855 [Deltaproteobacteria bacterium]|nr:hypothetical protein [Deltaproteobacteria bacterium]